jgi:hypothetical protein
MVKYFFSSLFSLVVGLLLSAAVAYFEGFSILSALGVCLVLCILEISISFDNAVVNAIVLKDMSVKWQKRFLTWGMLIAVFGMRLVFPLIIVCFALSTDPISALKISIAEPDKYASLMLESHATVASFGGFFLLLVALHFFFKKNREILWFRSFESLFTKLCRFKINEYVVCILILTLFWHLTHEKHGLAVLNSGVVGVLTYFSIKLLSNKLSQQGGVKSAKSLERASIGSFLYLEVLDASFSLDGVVGAFAITQHLLLITIGLGVGAFFVRSLTIYMVAKGTLQALVYLEHGAFYALLVLSLCMLTSIFVHVPEWFTGVSGACILALAAYQSVQFKKKNKI